MREATQSKTPPMSRGWACAPVKSYIMAKFVDFKPSDYTPAGEYLKAVRKEWTEVDGEWVLRVFPDDVDWVSPTDPNYERILRGGAPA